MVWPHEKAWKTKPEKAFLFFCTVFLFKVSPILKDVCTLKLCKYRFVETVTQGQFIHQCLTDSLFITFKNMFFIKSNVKPCLSFYHHYLVTFRASEQLWPKKVLFCVRFFSYECILFIQYPLPLPFIEYDIALGEIWRV